MLCNYSQRVYDITQPEKTYPDSDHPVRIFWISSQFKIHQGDGMVGAGPRVNALCIVQQEISFSGAVQARLVLISNARAEIILKVRPLR